MDSRRNQINRTLGDLFRTVHDFGGDVLQVTTSSIVVFFDAEIHNEYAGRAHSNFCQYLQAATPPKKVAISVSDMSEMTVRTLTAITMCLYLVNNWDKREEEITTLARVLSGRVTIAPCGGYGGYFMPIFYGDILQSLEGMRALEFREPGSVLICPHSKALFQDELKFAKLSTVAFDRASLLCHLFMSMMAVCCFVQRVVPSFGVHARFSSRNNGVI